MRDGGADVPMDALMVTLDERDETVSREWLDWYRDPAEGEDSSVVHWHT
ncbi:hypothetical protein [Streptomyces halobius]|uniref:Uncharacterized protein n=1 Tax=Streptomyces halobius TaxID=2879846 RepID=A0ABY4M877_9ACTN|nr:hypothetical protein [Streptomyces halobius]UQA93980.1 hypothetical protein K9S39_20750 [Streptomyces halobius]